MDSAKLDQAVKENRMALKSDDDPHYHAEFNYMQFFTWWKMHMRTSAATGSEILSKFQRLEAYQSIASRFFEYPNQLRIRIAMLLNNSNALGSIATEARFRNDLYQSESLLHCKKSDDPKFSWLTSSPAEIQDVIYPTLEESQILFLENSGNTWSDYMTEKTGSYQIISMSFPLYALPLYGFDRVEEVTDLWIQHELTEVTVYPDLLAQWDELKDYPLSWSIPLLKGVS